MTHQLMPFPPFHKKSPCRNVKDTQTEKSPKVRPHKTQKPSRFLVCGSDNSGVLRGTCQLSGARLGGAPSARAAATGAGLASETTTAALAARAGRLVPTAAAASAGTSSSSVVVGAAIGVGLGTALLNDDVLAVHGVGVGSHGGGVPGLRLELDEGAVLER